MVCRLAAPKRTIIVLLWAAFSHSMYSLFFRPAGEPSPLMRSSRPGPISLRSITRRAIRTAAVRNVVTTETLQTLPKCCCVVYPSGSGNDSRAAAAAAEDYLGVNYLGRCRLYRSFYSYICSIEKREGKFFSHRQRPTHLLLPEFLHTAESNIYS